MSRDFTSASVRRRSKGPKPLKKEGKGAQRSAQRKRKHGHIDKGLLIPLICIIAFGILMVFSASMYTSIVDGDGIQSFIKQLVFSFGGFLLMLAISRMDYRWFNKMSLAYAGIIVSALLLLAVRFIGVEANGARRWINLGITTFQPSELAKVAGCLYMAVVVVRHPEVRVHWKPLLLRCIFPMGVLCVLTAIEPSMSAAIAVAIPMVVILFLAVERFILLVPYIGLALGGVAALLITAPWRLERIAVFLGGGTQDYQIRQSLLAIGSGGIFGKGLGNGIQKYLFLPELQNDFIFANIGEETGLIGCMILLGLLALIVFRGIKNAVNAPDAFGFYYATGAMVLIGFQTVINVGVAVALLPVTGMALPFISAGGSSAVMLFIMMGPVLNMTRQVELKRGKLFSAGKS